MAVDINERATIRRLVVAGNDDIYYEDLDVAAGEMTELTTTGEAIDTSDQLNMFEAFQKVFVVNGAKLYVADFINTKLSTADVRPNDVTNAAPIRGTILTGGTTGAKMVVDYCDAANGAALIYGYTIYDAFDDNDEVVTGTNGSGTPVDVSFTLNAAPVQKPTWYAWTVYPTIGGVSFGTMPAKAYLGCLYRGRCVLSGNPNYPHQWYMSKTGDPWNWNYADTDPLTAAAGNNADAGETGDIIRALIPYKDDYLIFGCASTIWVLTGDPAGGGKIDEVDLTVGMFGANSWCFDGDGNLYFWGTAGIYKVPLGFRSVENLTEISLPNLVSDEDANPTTHRITMGYDRKRHGILICVTTLADGHNSNYFYDLKLNGFFPESYPHECGAYSLFYYAANDNDYADLLVGGKDGYIRKFSDAAAGKNDDAGASGNTAISSYVVWPIQHLTEDNDKEGKLTSLTIELSGGLATTKLTHAALATAHTKGDTLTQAVTGATMIVAFSNTAKTLTFGHSTTGVFTATANDITGTGDGTTFQATAVGTGSFTDTDGVSYEIHVGDDAETVIEKIKDGVAPHSSGTLSNAGRKARIRSRVRGAYLGIKLLNSELSESWAVNKVYGEVKKAGKIK